MRTIELIKIKPIGNLATLFDKLLIAVEKCEKEGYSEKVGRLTKLIVELGFTDFDWFDELEENESTEEVESIVIIGHLLVIRLNNIAQKNLNGIDMIPAAEQLMKDVNFMKYFPETIFV